MFDKTMVRGLLAAALLASAVAARADTVNIDTVLVGNPGNAADTTGNFTARWATPTRWASTT